MSDAEDTIWGHTEVHIEKVPSRRLWIVSTAHADPKLRQVLCEVPWADAFQSFPHNSNYAVAVATCQSDESTALTEEEEELVHSQPLVIDESEVTPVEVPKWSAAEYCEKAARAVNTNVLSIADFKARKKK